MLFFFWTPQLIRNLWQLKTAVFLHSCIICAVPLEPKVSSSEKGPSAVNEIYSNVLYHSLDGSTYFEFRLLILFKFVISTPNSYYTWWQSDLVWTEIKAIETTELIGEFDGETRVKQFLFNSKLNVEAFNVFIWPISGVRVYKTCVLYNLLLKDNKLVFLPHHYWPPYLMFAIDDNNFRLIFTSMKHSLFHSQLKGLRFSFN